MAITQISKIQVRSGNLAELPQLDTGELGLATNANRVFIGGNNAAYNLELLSTQSTISATGLNANTTESITIGGGNAGQVLVSDGNGNVQWANVSVSNVTNNPSGIDGSIQVYANAAFNNVTGFTFVGSNLNVPGNATLTGNLSVGNVSTDGIVLVANGYFAVDSTALGSDPNLVLNGAASFIGDIANSSYYIYIQNQGNSGNSSTDLAIFNDVYAFVDLGIYSSNGGNANIDYANLSNVLKPNDSYLLSYGIGPSGNYVQNTTPGNLVIGAFTQENAVVKIGAGGNGAVDSNAAVTIAATITDANMQLILSNATTRITGNVDFTKGIDVPNSNANVITQIRLNNITPASAANANVTFAANGVLFVSGSNNILDSSANFVVSNNQINIHAYTGDSNTPGWANSSGLLVGGNNSASFTGCVFVGGNLLVDGDVTFANTGNINAQNANIAGNITANGNVAITGDITVANINASGTIESKDITVSNGNFTISSGYVDITPVVGSNVFGTFTGNADDTTYVDFINENTGNSAQSSIAISNDITTDIRNYLNIGIAGSNYDGVTAANSFRLFNPSDSTVFSLGQSNVQPIGNANVDGPGTLGSNTLAGNLILGSFSNNDSAVKIAVGHSGFEYYADYANEGGGLPVVGEDQVVATFNTNGDINLRGNINFLTRTTGGVGNVRGNTNLVSYVNFVGINPAGESNADIKIPQNSVLFVSGANNSLNGEANFVYTSNTLSLVNLISSNLITGNTANITTVTANSITAGNIAVSSNLTVTNLVANGNVNLGTVTNVRVAGGNSRQFLQTDGNGNVTWADSGSGKYGVTLITGNNIVLTTANIISNQVFYVTSSSNAVSVVLPNVAAADIGQRVIFKLNGEQKSVTISPGNSITTSIDGRANLVVDEPWNSVTLVAVASNTWAIV